MQAGGFALLWALALGLREGDPREALEAAFHNLYAPAMLAGVELEIDDEEAGKSRVAFGYSRKRVDGVTKTLVYLANGRRPSPGALLLQGPGQEDRIFVTDGRYGHVRPMSARDPRWTLFSSDFSYEDLRAHEAGEYAIEALGTETLQGEPCEVLRLRPRAGPYRMLLMWLSTRRPVIVRTDLFDAEGLWKRHVVRMDRVVRSFEWWVPLEEEMLDLRSGRRTVRRIRNLLVDVELPDEVFTLTVLARGHLPSF